MYRYAKSKWEFFPTGYSSKITPGTNSDLITALALQLAQSKSQSLAGGVKGWGEAALAPLQAGPLLLLFPLPGSIGLAPTLAGFCSNVISWLP